MKTKNGCVEKGMFTARYIRAKEMMRVSSDQFAEIVNAIETEISKQSDRGLKVSQRHGLVSYSLMKDSGC